MRAAQHSRTDVNAPPDGCSQAAAEPRYDDERRYTACRHFIASRLHIADILPP